MTFLSRNLGLGFVVLATLAACASDPNGADLDAPDGDLGSGAVGSGSAASGGSLDGAGGENSGGVSVGGSGLASAGGATFSSGGAANPGAGGGAAAGGTGASAGGSSGGGTEGEGGAQSAGGSNGSGGGDSATGGTSAGGSGPGPEGSGVSIVGRQLFLDGEPFHIRGVNWNPVPKGANHPDGLDYAGFADQDIALMKAAGINAVRTYERLENTVVLDKLYAAGIYVFSTVYGWHGDDPSVVTARVNAAKGHPAIMAWVLGNEWNYNQLYANDGNTAGARAKINQAAALIKQADPSHPIASIWGGTGELGATVSQMPDIDIWGINFYGGLSLADVFNNWPGAGDGPMFLGEYGADAYNAKTNSVDTASQAEATRVLTQAIMDNYVTGNGGVTSGGFIFEWADEWWKDSGGSNSVQDAGGIAPGGGPYPDQTFNEEFWGIVDIDRNPRPAYDELKALYAR